MVRKCIVIECLSASSRPEDQGVTFHKFPVNETTKLQWLSQCHMPLDVQSKIMYVCSRHFRRVDFQTFKGTKYMLKTGAIPSMFPWGRTPDEELDQMKKETSKVKVMEKFLNDVTITPVSTKSDSENETNEDNADNKSDTNVTNNKDDISPVDIPAKNTVAKSKANKTTSKTASKQPESAKPKKKRKLDSLGTLPAAKTRKKTILITSTPKIKLVKKKIKKPKAKVAQNVKEEVVPEKVEVPNPQLPEIKFDLSSTNFVTGSRVEAKDFNEQWASAKVLEVDYEENEILIQFETNRSDEWIPMNSPRLRPIQRTVVPVVMFKVGEQCLARWTDSRKFPATVKKILENDNYEVLFDDGFTKIVPAAHVSKIRNRIPQANLNKKSEAKPKKTIPKTITKPIAKPVRSATSAESNNTTANKNNKSTVENKIKGTGNKTNVKRTLRKTGTKNDNENVKGNANNSKNNIDLNTTKISNMDNGLDSNEDTDSADEIKSEKTSTIEEPCSALQSGEWCCQWLDGVPVGKPGVIDAMEGLRNTVIVEDHRLPQDWTKHVVRRHTGTSAGKWDVILVSPQNRKFRSRKEIEAYFQERNEIYNPNSFDFSLHKKRAKEIGWDKVSSAKKRRISTETDIKTEKIKSPEVPVASLEESITIEQNKTVDLEEGFVMVGSLKVQIIDNLFRCPEVGCGKNFRKENLLQMHIKHYHRHLTKFLGSTPNVADLAYARTVRQPIEPEVPKNRYSNAQFYEKISKIDTQLKRVKQPLSPVVKAEPMEVEETETTNEDVKDTSIVELLKQEDITQEYKSPSKSEVEEKVCEKPANLSEPELETKINLESGIDDNKEKILHDETNSSAILSPESLYRKCSALEAELNTNKTIARHVSFDPDKTIVHRYEEHPKPTGIKRLLPIRRTLEKIAVDNVPTTHTKPEVLPDADVFVRPLAVEKIKYKRKGNKPGRKPYDTGLLKKLFTRDKKQHWERKMRGRKLTDLNSRVLKKSNFIKAVTQPTALHTSPSYSNIDNSLSQNVAQMESNLKSSIVDPTAESQILPERSQSPKYITEDGEKIKLVHMRREEIINCICRYCEEDGLMVQCELCLCWQHATCLGIEKESEVPDKYVCHICLNPQNIRESQRYLHDQDWLIEGKLPTMGMSHKENIEKKQSKEEFIRKINEVTGFIYELLPGIHTLQCKINIVEQKNHPKFYCWAKPWHDNKTEKQTIELSENKVNIEQSLVEIEDNQLESEIVQDDEDFEKTIESSITADVDNKNIMDELFIETAIEGPQIKTSDKDIENITNIDHISNMDNISASIDESNTDDLEALVKSNVFSDLEAHVDISAILESNDRIPSDSELVSILEEKLKPPSSDTSGSDTQSDDMECDNDLVKDNSINMEFFNLLNDDIKISSISKSKEGDLKDDETLLANLNVSPGQTKFDLFPTSSEFDLLAACSNSNVNFMPNPIVNHAPKAPEPEEAIDTENCRRNLLDHITRAQDKYEMLLDQLQEQVAGLISTPVGDDIDKRMAKTKLMIKMMMRDMDTLNDITNIPDEETERGTVIAK